MKCLFCGGQEGKHAEGCAAGKREQALERRFEEVHAEFDAIYKALLCEHCGHRNGDHQEDDEKLEKRCTVCGQVCPMPVGDEEDALE